MFFFLAYFTLYNRLQFHPPHYNWFKCILFNGWIIFHCVCVPQLCYPFICWWTSRLLPCPGYYKQCCNEHWGTCETISKVKRQPSEWEKIIANEATDKHLISKIYKQLLAAQFQKNKPPNQKMGQRTKQTFPQEDIQMANKHMKRCSTSLIIRKMQIKQWGTISLWSEWLLS